MILIVYSEEYTKTYFAEAGDVASFVLKKQELGLRHSLRLDVSKSEKGHFVTCDMNWAFNSNGEFVRSLSIDEKRFYGLKNSLGDSISVIFVFDETVMPSMDKYVLATGKDFKIGSSADCDISFSFHSYVGSVHSCLKLVNGKWKLLSLSKNGTYVNGRKVGSNIYVNLSFGDEIDIIGLRMIYFGSMIAVWSIDSSHSPAEWLVPFDASKNGMSFVGSAERAPLFSRSPRSLPPIITGDVNIDPPPAKQEAPQKSMISLIGRPLTMSIPMLFGCLLMALSFSGNGSFMFLGVVTAVTSALLGAGWAMYNVSEEKKNEEAKEKKRFNTYGKYLISISSDLASKYAQNYKALNQMYRPASECITYNERSRHLWERNPSQSDFLFARIGLGNIPFQVNVKIPKSGFSDKNDILLDLPEKIRSEYSELSRVPVGVNLAENRLVGIVGKGNARDSVNMAQVIIADIISANCYTDVKIVLLNSSDKQGDWQFLRWVPHCWSVDKKIRFFSSSVADVENISYDLVKILRNRSERKDIAAAGPYYILVVTEPSLLENNLLQSYVLNPKDEYGLSTIIVASSYSELPNDCRFCIEVNNKYCAVNDLLDVNRPLNAIKKDTVSVAALNSFAHTISGIMVEEKDTDKNIPSMVDFLSMYSVKTVNGLRIEERWRTKQINESIGVPIGVKAGGELCVLDIHEKYHGPHGLVAGTTGSGKSETLQSYILSLCVNFSPEEINFFIIDYKGGGMANLFEELPHLVGNISNLSGNGIRRAMISIKSESQRRQRLFNEYGVNSINQYTKLYFDGGTQLPIPHLLIIIDEFAELKKAEPEFMKEIISIAQVGRSLGIHLILSTQKPSGTVDDNIRSNSKFRLCLRVQSKQDSIDMIGKPDAAYITQAGGCIMQVGNDEIFEPFQSAYSGAAYDNTGKGSESSGMMITNTGASAVTGNRLKLKRAEEEKLNWYCGIVAEIRENAREAALNLSDLSMRDINRISEKTTETFAAKHPESKDDLSQLNNVFSIWPKNSDDLSDKQISEIIIREASKANIRIPAPEQQTQLEAVVDKIMSVYDSGSFKTPFRLWLPVLPQFISIESLKGWENQSYVKNGWREPGTEWTLETPVGLIDDPANQIQVPLYVDFVKGGNHAVIGSVVSGKSTFIQTVLYGLVNGYSPAELNLYIVDFSSKMLSPFKELPHTGGIVFENENEKLDKLFRLLDEILEERKRIIYGGSFGEYVKLNPGKLPSIVVVIDNYAAFKEKTDGKYEQQIMQLSRDGLGYGIFLLLSASGFGLSEISGRMSENIRTVFTLELTDKFKYMDTLRMTGINILPETGVKGRGLVKLENRCLEYQTALINDSPDDFSRSKQAVELFTTMKNNWKGACARCIPEIPENPVLSEFSLLPEYKSAVTNLLLPVGYDKDDASIFSVDLKDNYCYTVAGPVQSGKSNFLRLVANAAASISGAQVVIFSENDASMQKLAQDKGYVSVNTEEEAIEYFKKLSPVFVERNKKKRALLDSGLMKDEVFEKMQEFPPVFILIDNLQLFFNNVYTPGAGLSKSDVFIENILNKGALHNIYIFGAVNSADIPKLSVNKGFLLFTRDKAGILFETAPSAQRIFDFGKMSLSDSGKVPPFGNGLTAVNNSEGKEKKQIVLPLAVR